MLDGKVFTEQIDRLKERWPHHYERPLMITIYKLVKSWPEDKFKDHITGLLEWEFAPDEKAFNSPIDLHPPVRKYCCNWGWVTAEEISTGAIFSFKCSCDKGGMLSPVLCVWTDDAKQRRLFRRVD